MDFFNKIKEPIFLKDSSNAESQLETLKSLEPLLNSKGQTLIKQDIRNLEYGIAGEKNIAFELKNSHMPMYILHDIYLEDGDLNAQIDYLVFTKKMCFVIECKNLYGDIEINSSGDFIRTVEFGGKKTKEGIYSPITQNQRHLELLKKIKYDNKSNVFTRFITDRYFENYNKSLVVLANPKTILNDRFAKKELKKKVIRADQLVKYIKDMYAESKEPADSEEYMLKWANSYLNLHKDVQKDYSKKYTKYYETPINLSEMHVKEFEIREVHEKNNTYNKELIEETDIFKELKSYRLNKSRELNIKAYLIYNDSQLKNLISIMPRNIEELYKVSGFGQVKAEKYGDDLLKIIRKY